MIKTTVSKEDLFELLIILIPYKIYTIRALQWTRRTLIIWARSIIVSSLDMVLSGCT
jgi:hypothetical protein